MSTPEQMARDARYPTDFEWGKLLFLLGGELYEAKTVTNVREIVEWQRARIAALEEDLHRILDLSSEGQRVLAEINGIAHHALSGTPYTAPTHVWTGDEAVPLDDKPVTAKADTSSE